MSDEQNENNDPSHFTPTDLQYYAMWGAFLALLEQHINPPGPIANQAPDDDLPGLIAEEDPVAASVAQLPPTGNYDEDEPDVIELPVEPLPIPTGHTEEGEQKQEGGFGPSLGELQGFQIWGSADVSPGTGMSAGPLLTAPPLHLSIFGLIPPPSIANEEELELPENELDTSDEDELDESHGNGI